MKLLIFIGLFFLFNSLSADESYRTLQGHDGCLNAIAFSSEGKYIGAVTADRFYLWDVENSSKIVVKNSGSKSIAISSSNLLAISNYFDYSLWPYFVIVFPVIFVSNVIDKMIDKEIIVTSLTLSDKEMNIFKVGKWDINSLAFSPDGRYIAAGSTDDTIKLFSLSDYSDSNKKPKVVFKGHSGDVNSVAFSPDGKYIVSGSNDDTLKLWFIDGTLINTFKGHTGDVNSVAFSPDGNFITSGGDDDTIRLWAIDGTLIKTIKGHSSDVNSVAFSPDGRYIVSGSDDDTVKLWSVDGNLIRTYEGHNGDVTSVAFSPDGRYIASGSCDGTVKLWSTSKANIVLVSKEVSRPKLPPNLSIKLVDFVDSDGNKILDAEENGEFVITVENSGQGVAYSVSVELVPDENYKGIKIGRAEPLEIPPQREAKVKIPISADRSVLTGNPSFKILASEGNGFDATPVIAKIETREFRPPFLKIADIGINEISAVERNNRIEPGEAIEVKAIIQNAGKGVAKGVRVTVVLGDPNIFITSDEKEFYLGDMRPGDWREMAFTFSVAPKYSGGETLPISLKIDESRREFSRKESLGLKIGKLERQISEIVFKGKAEDIQAIRPLPALTVDIEKNIPKAKRINKDAVGVVIGVRDYKNPGVPKVDFAINDAQLVREYLIRTLGYRKENIIYLENPTKGDLERVFGNKDNPEGQLYNYVKKGKSDIFVYYSGHGAPDLVSKKPYLVPSDCHPDYVKTSGYSLEMLYNNLSKLPAKSITVVLDACFSGSSASGKMLIANASALVIVEKPELVSGANIFTASRFDQVASWYPEMRHSLFTYYFLKGLQGAADIDKDGVLTYKELYDYVKENVAYEARRLHNRNQEPTFTGDENKIFVRYK